MSHEAQNHSCDMFSSVARQKMTSKDITPCNWKDNMISTMQFCSALTHYLGNQADDPAILEVGPHPALKGPAKEILQCQGRLHISYFHTLFRHRNDMETLLENVGDIIAAGINAKEPSTICSAHTNVLRCCPHTNRIIRRPRGMKQGLTAISATSECCHKRLEREEL